VCCIKKAVEGNRKLQYHSTHPRGEKARENSGSFLGHLKGKMERKRWAGGRKAKWGIGQARRKLTKVRRNSERPKKKKLDWIGAGHATRPRENQE